MEKVTFLNEFRDALELTGNINENTSLHLTSLQILVVIAFVDENFNMQIKSADLRNVNSVNDLMHLIGFENFS